MRPLELPLAVLELTVQVTVAGAEAARMQDSSGPAGKTTTAAVLIRPPALNPDGLSLY